jgi:hypothetical protein
MSTMYYLLLKDFAVGKKIPRRMTRLEAKDGNNVSKGEVSINAGIDSNEWEIRSINGFRRRIKAIKREGELPEAMIVTIRNI